MSTPTSTSSSRRGPRPNPETKGNLIKAGMDMLHQMGYSATGIKDIVDSAGVPKGSFYNHFESKEDFAGQIIDIYFEQALPQIAEHLENPDISPLERLRTYFEQRAESFITSDYFQGCLLGNFSLEMGDHSTEIRQRTAEHFNTWTLHIEKCIEESQQKGEITSPLQPALLARFVLNSWEGALVRMRSDRSDMPLRDFMDVIFTTVLI
ncbi:TetR family transcriptional regulator C-terminal domain-containing protein [Salmonella enterica]|uniref:TetR/AcrR family transcriptional regulator n=1 Tax=Enterobacterales TaxID=91347 RepID=UPI0018D28F7B|nr:MULTISPECIES: TetR/AcrR family transcriptional regulator [Klebsiella/Raoultella group]EHV0482784.1 TetR family transcriptional regulator C-terminal domain-containing protein [Salmonella enterica]EIB3239860.1 TetR family transcriptional regulator C-terminal domain-containing protein [Salmonella enterica]EIB4793503.1 TetR family transcriptional regulator C-terminal domain-containing protein [Salmonella enterica]EIF6812822.1 TetR family transcriptional regulator C-terminal domain-containing pro